MKKKILLAIAVLMIGLSLTACWPGEVGITTVFNQDGSGTRTIVLDVMDDTLSTEPIINPDDPDQTEGKGAVINNQHITGGLPEIQTWFVQNAPEFMTVKDMTVEGYHRYFTLEYSWTDFEDFLAKYEQLVNLSDTISWDDFTEEEKPALTTEGLYTKELTFTESKVLVEASLDWAITGIYEDIYEEATLAGWVTKADISVLAGYTVTINENTYEELPHFDADAADGDEGLTGVRVFVESDDFTVTGAFSNTGLLVGTIVGVVAILGIVGFVVLKKRK